ncbi:DUF4253 domain-containing protein [Streptomyces sp. NBC_01214]|uniref:DUF4253 domain-containing protein n=1 Tax=Streptomyces sp. NBC_01214 TaxID=2903777 RepID=UPI002258DC94|nr:DUF4253 domain-containing protein [Streptomyces sp. NBC_01214]MCX4801401.1 DUF4253 domain-containing protein [Streptomyces sp. NBC_01214]
MSKSPKPRNPLSVLADDPQGRSLGLELPPGSLIDRPGRRGWWKEPRPLLWVSDEAVGSGALAAHRTPALAAAGLQAVLLQGRRGLERWWQAREFSPERMSDPDDHHVEPVLREFWSAVVPDPEEGAEGEELIAPFGRDWPGLAEGGAAPDDPGGPDAVACGLADGLIASGFLPSPRLALVPAGRGADVPAAMGWCGPTNHETDTALISTVLRSWEDRFGARVVALGFDELHVSVAAPPRTVAHALPVAAEHFAFSPDNVWQGSGSIRAYADEAVTGSNHWGFWWD